MVCKVFVHEFAPSIIKKEKTISMTMGCVLKALRKLKELIANIRKDITKRIWPDIGVGILSWRTLKTRERT